MKLKRIYANIILAVCITSIIGILVYAWVTAPLILYGMVGLMLAGIVFGGIMNRNYIRMEVRRVIDEWKAEQAKSDHSG